MWLLLAVVLLLVFSYYYLRGADLSYLDTEGLPQPDRAPSEAHHEVVASLSKLLGASQGKRGRARLISMREQMDSISEGREFVSSFTPVSEGNIRGEWVVAPDADPARRILYIHGGAWLAGSPKSHRSITNKLSRVAGAAVFSVDYRLMPEHRRLDGIVDCRDAYRWILHNGPDGEGSPSLLVVGGDSAGGNLTLSLLAWVRDEGLRAPDAAIAFSPATDATMSSPSLRTNLATDPMLGPAFGYLTRYPQPLLWWVAWLTARMRPSNPDVSPLRGDLGGLPPLLVQVSEAEMLLDDARRYVHKAQLAGSPVELQSWPHMVHVWQVFTPELPEAEEAYERIAQFLQRVENDTATESAAA